MTFSLKLQNISSGIKGYLAMIRNWGLEFMWVQYDVQTWIGALFNIDLFFLVVKRQ